MSDLLKIKVVLFAMAKEITGSDSVEIEMTHPATILDLKVALAEKFPTLKNIVSRSAFAVDHEFAVDGTTLNEDMEVGLIPPVSGG